MAGRRKERGGEREKGEGRRREEVEEGGRKEGKIDSGQFKEKFESHRCSFCA